MRYVWTKSKRKWEKIPKWWYKSNYRIYIQVFKLEILEARSFI